jgi:hypothetical protein
MILTVAMEPEYQEFRIACVKNRFAKHSAMGDKWIALKVDASRMTLKDEDLMQQALRFQGVKIDG